MTRRFVMGEKDIPRQWFNVAADLPSMPPPPLHPGTRQPVGPDDLAPLFPMQLILQEVSQDRFIPIPEPILDVYAMWRPTPLYRATAWEQALGTDCRIFYKYEGVSPAGSHKPNTSIPQAWYNAQEGVKRITTETGAHYVFKKAEDMDQTHERLRMNPPVRWGHEGHGPELLAGVKDGRVNQIATDHSPHTAEEKLTGDIWTAISGYPQVEISVRLWLTHGVNTGKMTLQEFVRATSEGPAKTWDLYPQKGCLAVGSDGDLTILDLNEEGVIRDDELHSKNHVTPFDGDPYKGNAVATILRGRIIMKNGKLTSDKSNGQLVRPKKTASTWTGGYR